MALPRRLARRTVGGCVISGRPRLLSNADLDRAKALVRSGSRQKAVAAALGVSPQTLSRRLKQPYKEAERRW